MYKELSAETHSLTGAIVNRAEAQAMRLAFACALLDGQTAIDTRHIESALALWRYATQSAAFLFGEKTIDPMELRIVALLKMGTATTTQIHRAFSGHVSRERLQTVLGNLEAANKIAVEKQPSRGRPCTVVALREAGPE